MRVGIDTRFYSSSPTGIGRYTYELCIHLLKTCDIELVLFHNPDSPVINDPDFEHVEKLLVNEKIFSITELFTLPWKINKSHLDIYHSPSIIMPFVKNVKTVMNIHDLIHLKFPQDYSPLHKYYYEFFVKKAAYNADQLITISNASKKDLEEWLKNIDVKVTYLAANEKFQPHLGITDIFSRFEIRRTNFILSVGNSKPHKNIKRLLKAYARVKEKYDNFPDLLIVCEKSQEIDKLIKNLFITENVKVTGNISEDELILLYSYCSFFVFPSLYEGFGMPVLEAMSCGAPVTCSDKTSLPEVAGDSALYFDPYDIESISKALEEMYINPDLRDELSLKSRRQKELFSWEKTANETYEIYKNILK